MRSSYIAVASLLLTVVLLLGLNLVQAQTNPPIKPTPDIFEITAAPIATLNMTPTAPVIPGQPGPLMPNPTSQGVKPTHDVRDIEASPLPGIASQLSGRPFNSVQQGTQQTDTVLINFDDAIPSEFDVTITEVRNGISEIVAPVDCISRLQGGSQLGLGQQACAVYDGSTVTGSLSLGVFVDIELPDNIYLTNTPNWLSLWPNYDTYGDGSLPVREHRIAALAYQGDTAVYEYTCDMNVVTGSCNSSSEDLLPQMPVDRIRLIHETNGAITNPNDYPLYLLAIDNIELPLRLPATTRPDEIRIPDDADDFLLYPLPAPPETDLQITRGLIESAGLNLRELVWEDVPYGSCDASSRDSCARYAYAFFYAFFDIHTGRPPTIWDWLSASYTGEMNTWGTSYGNIPLEALNRNFLDLGFGGCRHQVQAGFYLCTYEYFIEWTAGIQFWIDAVQNSSSDAIQGNVQEMLRLRSDTIQQIILLQEPVDTLSLHNQFARGGMFDFDGFIFDNTPPNLPTWRSGQGPDVPSTWGNEVLNAGTGTYSGLDANEHYAPIIIHVFSDGTTTQGYPNEINGETPECTYVALITTTENRIANVDTC